MLGVFAASLALGAVHLEIASGGDLKAGRTDTDAGIFGTRGLATTQPELASHDVNRDAKADRLGNPLPGMSGPTMVFTVAAMQNTSVATFTPLGRTESFAPAINAERARAIMHTTACEPPVSALTELARKIENGRCVT
jgi:hypothetical protein